MIDWSIFLTVKLSSLLIVVGVLAGCGGGSAAKPTATPVPAAPPTVTPSGPVPGMFVFGTGRNGMILHGGPLFSNPHQILWIANLAPIPSTTSLRLTATQSSGPGRHPKLVGSEQVSVTVLTKRPSGWIVSGGLSRGQMKTIGIRPGRTYTLAYREGRLYLASGTIRFATGGGSSGGGY
ncbi:MAG TPA: hypothetical protein VG815_19175 [Chloroflexota bacterium]|nr:hypothetical protein [Chloroflexota bacterium]